METSKTLGAAAPVPAAVELPRHTVRVFSGRNELRVRAARPQPPFDFPEDARICMSAGEGSCTFTHWMTPAQARELAVYLIDCANALDNPAQRLIVESLDLTAMHRCSECGALTDCPTIGEGIGHE